MKIRMQAKDFGEVLGLAGRAIQSRSPQPILSYAYLRAQQELEVYGTNGDLGIVARAAAEVAEPGEILLPAQLLTQVVAKLPGDEVVLEASGSSKAAVSSGHMRVELQAADASEYPRPAAVEGQAVALDGAVLAAALRRVIYAAASEEFRAVFRGIQLELQEQGLRLVASDGFRLAYQDLVLPGGPAGKYLVPARAASEFLRVLGPGQATLHLTERRIALVTDRAVVTSSLMEGDFPDYKRVIPDKKECALEADAQELREAVSRVAILADRNSNRVDLLLHKKKLRVESRSDYGQGRDELEVSHEGPDMETAFNARFLTEALAVIDGTVRIEFSGQISPAIFRDRGDQNYLALIVPLRMG
ncbi:MAG: DNA polymerase III subunit beta [Deinococcus sp.]|nr:DNA polymerase III subunit beta [Deinococcus sp.]